MEFKIEEDKEYKLVDLSKDEIGKTVATERYMLGKNLTENERELIIANRYRLYLKDNNLWR